MASPDLPPGDADPHVIYIAVGKAIHRWEQLEQAFARLCLKLAGIPDLPANYPRFGKENGTFAKRIATIEATAQSYFTVHPDQEREGQFAGAIRRVQELSIERHRIAHGHITQWAKIELPQEKGAFEVAATFLYRWAPPFYGVEKLRTDPIGACGAEIDATSEQFELLNHQVTAFTERLPELRPSPDKRP